MDFRRLVLANTIGFDNPVLVSLTYREDTISIELSRKDLNAFAKRVCNFFGRSVRYIAVTEFQKRGAIHYHVMFFNLPRVDHSYIQAEWGYHVWIENVYRTKGLYSYLVKYITKSFQDHRFKGKKRYLQTLIHQPFIVRNREEAHVLAQPLLMSSVPIYSPYTYPVFDRNGQVVNEITKVDYLDIPPDKRR